jgi:hypothetical protein
MKRPNECFLAIIRTENDAKVAWQALRCIWCVAGEALTYHTGTVNVLRCEAADICASERVLVGRLLDVDGSHSHSGHGLLLSDILGRGLHISRTSAMHALVLA